MAKIDLSRYSEDMTCIEPKGLRKKLLADLLPTVKKYGLQRNRLIVATYVKPSVTKGGIIMPLNTQEEDRYQGKVGLLIAVGPSAFDFDEVREAVARAVDAVRHACDENGETFTDKMRDQATAVALKEMNVPMVGDWVAYRNSETHEFGVPVNGEHTLASCRMLTDDSIVMRVSDPRLVY
jgi:co-chaperonin GroES (HSP10)